jgi:hypothetical protein
MLMWQGCRELRQSSLRCVPDNGERRPGTWESAKDVVPEYGASTFGILLLRCRLFDPSAVGRNECSPCLVKQLCALTSFRGGGDIVWLESRNPMPQGRVEGETSKELRAVYW